MAHKSGMMHFEMKDHSDDQVKLCEPEAPDHAWYNVRTWCFDTRQR